MNKFTGWFKLLLVPVVLAPPVLECPVAHGLVAVALVAHGLVALGLLVVVVSDPLAIALVQLVLQPP